MVKHYAGLVEYNTKGWLDKKLVSSVRAAWLCSRIILPQSPWWKQKWFENTHILCEISSTGRPHSYVIVCTLWLFNIAMENGPFIDGLPIKHGDFPWLC